MDGESTENSEALALRAARGDRQAFAILVRRYQRPLFAFLGRMSLSPTQADDVAQEAFVRAWTGLARFDPDKARFVTWLFTIARNQAIDELNRRATAAAEPADAVLDIASDQPGPDLLVERAQSAARLQRAIRRLAPNDRSVLALAYVRELDMTQIARIEGLSVAAVKTRLHRSRRQLRAWLEQDDETAGRNGT